MRFESRVVVNIKPVCRLEFDAVFGLACSEDVDMMFSRNVGATTLHDITTRKLEVRVFCLFCLCLWLCLTYRDGSDAGSRA